MTSGKPHTKPRPGHSRIPRSFFQAHSLSTDHRWLLAYFASHAPRWQFQVDRVLEDLGWGDGKYYQKARELEAAGYIIREKLYRTDEESGKRVVAGFTVQASFEGDLTRENRQLENRPNYRKPKSSKSIALRSPTSKGHPASSEVIDEADDFASSNVVDLPARRVVGDE